MAQAEVGSLRVALSASAAAFAKNMREAKNHVRSNAKGMERAMIGVKKSFNAAMKSIRLLGAAAAAGAAGLAYMVKRSIDTADSIGKLSKRLGASTEALSEYRHVAELSGVTFETLTMGWQRMTRRVAEAANGMGEARGALRELGLSATQLAQLAPEEQFEVLADALSKVKGDADRVRLAMKLFDSEGVSLIQTMTGGAAGIREMRMEAKALGLSLSAETVKAAEDFNDNLVRLTNISKGYTNVIMEALLPTLENYTNSMIKAAKETGDMGEKAEIANTGLKLILSGGTLVATAFKAAGRAIGGFAAAASLLVQGEFKASFEAAKSITIDFVGEYKDAIDNVDQIWNDAAEKVKNKSQKTGKDLASPAEEANKYIVSELEKMTDALESFYVASDQDIVADLNAHLERFRKNEETSIDNALTLFFDFMDAKKDKHEDTLSAMTEFEIQAYRNMESYAANSFFNVMQGNYDNLLDSFVTMLQRMVSEWLAAKAMMAAFGPEFGKGGKLGGIVGGLLGVFSGKPVGMANGGMITEPIFGVGQSGQTYRFGEGGINELVIPEGRGSGSVAVSVNIDARGADSGVDARLRQLVPQITGAATKGTLEAIRRGGYAREVARG